MLTIQQNEQSTLMYQAIRKFGYKVTVGYVRESMERLLDATYRPQGGPEGFMALWMRDNGLRPSDAPLLTGP